MLPYFKKDNCEAVRLLGNLVRDDPMVAHDALKALINLSSDTEIQSNLNNEQFLSDLTVSLVIPNSLLADLVCMLLNNLTMHLDIVHMLIPMQSNTVLDNLLEVFVRGDSKKFNPNADFNFLSGLFANISVTQGGAKFLLGKSTIDQSLRLSRLVAYTEHPNLIRRGGVISTLKNVCFYHENHKEMLESAELNLLVYLLLPLCGNEEFDLDDLEKMPEELQLLEESKQRESDPKLRLMLVETLVLLTATQFGRDYQRQRNVYRVIQKLHLWEKDQAVVEAIERLVDMIARDEAENPKIQQVTE